MPLARHDLVELALYGRDCRFLLTCLLRGMTGNYGLWVVYWGVSTHMPLARHDCVNFVIIFLPPVSTHMPLARHDRKRRYKAMTLKVSTHMPLARHDGAGCHFLHR